MSSYDVVVIGSGPGGYVAAIRARQLGLTAACIELGNLGGVCLNVGCIPSKALLKSAEVANMLRHVDDYGISIEGMSIDFAKVVKRSRRVAKKSEKGVNYLFKKYGVVQIKGRGKLLGDGQVEVTSGEDVSVVTGKHVIVATGARARWFPGMEPDGEKILTYREAIVRDELPKSAIVLGAGAIGLEFAYFWHAMGCDVTVVEGADRLAPFEDEDVSAELERAFKKSGIKSNLGVFCDNVKATNEGTQVTLKDGTVLQADVTLLALGVRANIEDLGLEEVGVKTDRGFITTDGSCRTSVPGVYAIGDVAGPPMLAHKASVEAHICVEKLAGHGHADLDPSMIPAGTFCQPQIASVGKTEKQCKDEGLDYKVGTFPFAANGKNRGTGDTAGFVKVILGGPYDELLGAHIIGNGAVELLGELVLMKSGELDAETFLNAIHAHPTSSEAVMEAVASALGVSVHI
ncbi:MAG: dihydrolipoyl dehydrogenase [Proteobacteria bacterium]|nr:dihydrolipoyl dehydrogenase [Pseudomonadota bacterium]MCP4915777.1 dihydrolipoyl dehydrogenase [Pseudomonadota bacterium]